MSEPKKNESDNRHPWRNEEEENRTIDTNIQKEMIINQIANILRKSKKKANEAEDSEEE